MITKDELNALDAEDAGYRSEFRKIARERLRDYASAVTDPAPRFGENAFICPCCGSGSGNNGKYTPAFTLFRTQEGELHFKCHACDATGDIFDLARLVGGLPDFDSAERAVASFLGISLARRTPLEDVRTRDVDVAAPLSQRETLQLKKEACDYILACRKDVGLTDYFHSRGLADATISRFHLGYDAKQKMAVIPFSSTYYVSRNTQVGVDKKGVRKHYKPEGLQQPLFNLSALSDSPEPVFLTEAPMDAMSIEQSGGRAIALGGTSTLVLAKVLDAYKPGNVFVLAFDNDGPGERLQDKVGLMLEERSIPYSLPVHDAFFAFKDANAALMTNPDALAEGVAEEKRRARSLLEERRSGKPISEKEAVDQILGTAASPVKGDVSSPFPPMA